MKCTALFITSLPLTFLIEEGENRQFACYLKAGKITDNVRDFTKEEMDSIYDAAFKCIDLIKEEMDSMIRF
ncbi:MAG: hypothetical protein ACLS95_04115 [Clostridia bacterium]